MPILCRSRIVILVLSVLLPFTAAAQNLFPNPDFEQYNACPDKLSQHIRCSYWNGWAWNTPDYYNCGYYEQDFTGTPYAYPYKGTGVMGFVTFRGPSGTYTEGISAALVQRLKAGRNYRLTFHLAIASQGIAATTNFGEDLAFGFYFYNKTNRPGWGEPGSIAPCASFTPQVSVFPRQLDTFDRYKEFSFCFTPADNYDSVFIGSVCAAVFRADFERVYYFNLDDISLIEQPDLPLSATISADSICANGCIDLGISDTSGLEHFGYDAPGATGVADSLLPLHLCYSNAGKFPISVWLSRKGNCAAFKWQDTVVVSSVVVPRLPDTTLCPGQVLLIDFRSYPGMHVLWEDGDTTLIRSFDKSGTYGASFLSGGCVSSARFRLDVVDFCTDEVIVPSAFSPNGDGLNDLFHVISNYPLSNYNIRIYNRWGQCVFQHTDYRVGWDGGRAEVGTYFYRISFEHPATHELVSLKGDVSLIR